VAAGGAIPPRTTRTQSTNGHRSGQCDRPWLLGLTAAKRNQGASTARCSAPLLKSVELSAAMRYDHYFDVGKLLHAQAGINGTPITELRCALPYAGAFAHRPGRNGVGGAWLRSTAAPIPCCELGRGGRLQPGHIALITSPIPRSRPSRSESWSAAWSGRRPSEEQRLARLLAGSAQETKSTSCRSMPPIAAGLVARDPVHGRGAGRPGPPSRPLLAR